MTARPLTEYRAGRNFVRVGDIVRARPPVGGPFLGRVSRLDETPAGIEVSLVVLYRLNGSDHPKRGMSRVVFSTGVERVDQTRWKRDS